MKTLDLSQPIIGYDQEPIPLGGIQIIDKQGQPLANLSSLANDKASDALKVAFETVGLTLKVNESPLTLKTVLLVYLRQASVLVDKQGAAFNDTEQALLHGLAMRIAGSKSIDLEDTEEEYQLLCRMTDGGKVKPPQGEVQSIYGNEIRMEVRRLVRAAAEKVAASAAE